MTGPDARIGGVVRGSDVSRLQRLLNRLRGVPIRYDLRAYELVVQQIGSLEDQIQALDDASLAAEVQRTGREGSLNEQATMVRMLALTREIARREIGLRAFGVQLVAALGLQDSQLVEMQTGEGKTLAIAFAAAMWAFSGRGVHVLTFNDYLADRDAAWMGPVYRALGLRVGVIRDGMSREARREAYAANITYAAAKQVGFDLLRDGLALDPSEQVLRPLHAVIVDEADALLVDEARVPMVIAGVEGAPPRDAYELARLAKALEPNKHYEVYDEGRAIALTDAGMRRCERWLGCGELVSEDNLDVLNAVHCAVHAEALLHSGVDYILRDGRIELVDEFTGRVMQDRRWPYGLQAALEAKEGLPLRPEGRIYGSIAVQHVLGCYERLAGVTATAHSAAEELFEAYKLVTMVVPTAKPCIREDAADVIFDTRKAKDRALVEEVCKAHASGRPVLVATPSVAESERLAGVLREAGIELRLLNARNDAEEAVIVARAGEVGAVTVATNMAGRGTDILLGAGDSAEHARVAALGGLYVIGTSRHEARRVDRQLRGRAGRQGDPGESRFFLCLEDDLIKRYGVRRMLPKRALDKSGGRLNSQIVGHYLDHAQRIIEGQYHTVRTRLRQISQLPEAQRKHLQQVRNGALHGETQPAQLAPDAWARLVPVLGRELAAKVLRRLFLRELDRHWSDHLAYVSGQTQTLFLEQLGHHDPLLAHNKRVAQAFDGLFRDVHQALERASQEIAERGQLDWSDAALSGPSTTWTYLVEDDPLSDLLGASLGNLGVAAAAAFGYWPLILGWAAARWWRNTHPRKAGEHVDCANEREEEDPTQSS